jgi:hypothetical protein
MAISGIPQTQRPMVVTIASTDSMVQRSPASFIHTFTKLLSFLVPSIYLNRLSETIESI